MRTGAGGDRLRRLAAAPFTLLAILTVTFLAAHLPPGDPFDALGADAAPAEPDRAALRRLYGMDRPLPARFAVWLGRAATLDFGASITDGRPVLRRIGERLPRTLLLMGTSLGLAFLLALPLGLLAARREGRISGRAVAAALLALHAVPVFWLGTLLLTFLGKGGAFLPLFPVLWEDPQGGPVPALPRLLHHLALPAACLASGLLPVLARQVRAGALAALGSDFIRAARARGLPEREVLLRHVLPHAAVPLAALSGLILPRLAGGSVVVETLFSIPGIGSLGVEAAARRDIPVVMGLTTLAAVLTLLGSLLSDLALSRLDPRTRGT